MDVPQAMPNQPVTPTNKPDRSIIVLIIIAALMLLGLAGMGGYILGINQVKNGLYVNQNQTGNTVDNSNENQVPAGETSTSDTDATAPSGSEIVSVDGTTSRYVNHTYGFSVTYPTHNRVPSTCQEKKEGKTGEVPLKVFEAPNSNTIYISEETVVVVKNKRIGSTYQYDFSTCKVVPNSLDLLEHGYENGLSVTSNPSLNVSKPEALQMNYQKIENDNDLQTLSQTLYKNCLIGTKQLADNNAEIYNVKLVDQNGQNNVPESGCFTNFVYWFLYSPANHVAVITNGFQSAPFFGTNEQSEPQIEFPVR